MPTLTTFLMRFPVKPFQSPPAHPVAKRRHLVEDRVDTRHHIFTVDEDRLVPRRAEGDVEDGAILGDVDLLAAEHRLDAPAQVAIPGQLEQKVERIGGNAVLRIIEVETHRLGLQPFASLRVVREQIAQMQRLNLLVMRGECPARRASR